MTYSEKLRHPEWQKKRLSILNRDKFTCQLCKDQDTKLHVHHKSYTYGCEPWDYPDENFISYCRHCHKAVEFMGKLCTPYTGMKIYNSEELYFITTIVFNHREAGLIVSIDRHRLNGVLEPVVVIKHDTFEKMTSLFQDAEKLIANAKQNTKRLDTV